ncbi:MAG: hypothetical protein ACYCZY_02235 [Lacisediminihabitans sp.]
MTHSVRGSAGRTTLVRTTLFRSSLVLAVGSITAFGLAACTVTTPVVPTASASPSASSQPSSSPSPTASPSATPTAPPQGTPTTVSCNGLLSPQVIYDYNPNFTLKADYTPKAGSDASKAVGYRGLACGWINQTSSGIISVAVAHPAAADLAALRSAAASGTAVSGLGDAAWFRTAAGVGELQAFSGPFWITASSSYFGSPDDVRGLVAAAVATAR